MIRFEFPLKIRTHNELKRWWSNPRPHVGRALYRKYIELLRILFMANNPSYCCKGRPRTKKVVRILYYTKKLQDPDNFSGSLKPILDVMVRLELLTDDSPQYLKLVEKQVSDYGKAYSLIIEIS